MTLSHEAHNMTLSQVAHTINPSHNLNPSQEAINMTIS